MTRQKTANCEHPSSTAASSSSRGKERKNCRMRKTPKADVSEGSIIAASVSTRCSLLNMM